jgi:hypothetical protein
MFEPFIRVALLTSLLSTPLAAPIRPNNGLPLQDEMQQIETAVRSALPSGWNIIAARANESLWSTDKLRDRYKGYAIEIVGPVFQTEITFKGQTKAQTVTETTAAILYFIPVWTGINRSQLRKDWKEGESQRFPPSSQGEPEREDRVAYGWNTKYFLVCEHDCNNIVQRIAKKFNIPKR